MNQKTLTSLTWSALIAVGSGCVVNTLLALSSRPVAIPHRIRIHIPITIARLAKFNRSLDSRRISVKTIRTGLATLSKVPNRTLQTNHRIIRHGHACAIIRTRTPLTIERRSTQRISVIAPSALIASVSRRIMLTNTTTRLRVTDIRVLVTITGHTGHE